MSIIEIQNDISSRKITRLCHFVHTNKLLHILNSSEGIKAVDFIDEDVLVQNDKERYDGKTKYVNCSIQYPNYWYYKRVKDNNPLFKDWAIIFIDPIVMTWDTTMFCPVNAATARGKYIESGYDGFRKIYEDSIPEAKYPRARTPRMLRNAPTDDQAEVLVFQNIPREYITGIALDSEKNAKLKGAEWKLLNDVPQFDIYVSPELFSDVTSRKIRNGEAPLEIKYEEAELNDDASKD
nr:DarT ssDNA thymidine ADP-ribosyltransferase family protein [uncultured Lachnoclostridium sp.]